VLRRGSVLGLPGGSAREFRRRLVRARFEVRKGVLVLESVSELASA
jgi:hypothetical protein